MKPDRRDRTDITMAGSQDIIELPKKCMPDESNFDIRLTRAAKDWSSFTKVDTTEKEDLISDLTEDFETRLGEFDSLMQMVTEETGPKLFQNMVALQEKYRQLQVLFGKINTLEVMVARVKMNLDEVELYLNKAESTIIDPGCVTSTSYNSSLTGNEQTRKSKVLPNLMSNAFSIAEAGATNLLVNTSQLLGDGVWTQHPTTSQASNSNPNQIMKEGRQLERSKIFKAAEFFPAPEGEPHS